MAVDAKVDSTQLNSDLTSVANAIRTKGGTSAQLAFPAGFVSAINDISGGGSSVSPYDSNPSAAGTASPGVSALYARGDHVHPAQSVPSPQSSGTPSDLGTAARGSATTFSRSDHVHPMPTASDIGAILAPINPTTGKVLKFDGLSWIPDDVSTATDAQVQDAVDDYLDAHPPVGGTFTNEAKNALIALLEKVAYIDNDGQTLLDTLTSYLFRVTLSSITAVFTQGANVIYDVDTLDTLKQYLVVTANYSDGTSEAVSDYTLSGTLAVGTSTITVSYAGKTDTFTVTVSAKWSYSITDLTKATGTCSNSTAATCGMRLEQYGDGLNRRSFFRDNGATSIALASSSSTISAQTSDYYPIKVPAGATSFTVSVTPNTQYIQVLARSLTSGVYSTYATNGWTGYTQGSGTKTMAAAPDNVYLFVSTKYNSAGTSYQTEPTGMDVTFS